MKQLLLNRNEVVQGAAPKCIETIRRFSAKHVSRYFDGYFSSILVRKLSTEFHVPRERILIGYGAEHFLRAIFDSLNPKNEAILTHEFHYTYYDKYLALKKIKLHMFKTIEGKDSFVFDIEDCLGKY